LTPTWVFFAPLTPGPALTPPAITEIGHGQYLVQYDPTLGDCSGQIDCGPTLAWPSNRFIDMVFWQTDVMLLNLNAPVNTRMPSGPIEITLTIPPI
jgi:hypothetical protein